MTTAGLVGRLTGMATMLAAGCIIGLATAANSSAAPAESSTGTAADAEAGRHRAPAPAFTRRDLPTTKVLRAGSSNSRPRSIPGPAAVNAPESSRSRQSAPPASTVTSATTSSALDRQPPVPPQPALAVQSRAVPSTATLSTALPQARKSSPALVADASAKIRVAAESPDPLASSVRGRFLADPRGRRITIFKGVHFVVPNRWGVWVTRVSGDATFTDDSIYDLKDEDQYDWNKLAGITFTPWRPERNAGMVVWRYNLHDNTFEVGPFFDNNFAYVFPTEDEIITVSAEETFGYAVDYNGITVTYGDRTVFKPYPEGLKPNFWTSARVTGWFGGSEVAPRTLTYYLHMR